MACSDKVPNNMSHARKSVPAVTTHPSHDRLKRRARRNRQASGRRPAARTAASPGQPGRGPLGPEPVPGREPRPAEDRAPGCESRCLVKITAARPSVADGPTVPGRPGRRGRPPGQGLAHHSDFIFKLFVHNYP